ncbi:hypothetical protein KIL84_005251, partial [Mauremys mutica]
KMTELLYNSSGKNKRGKEYNTDGIVGTFFRFQAPFFLLRPASLLKTGQSSRKIPLKFLLEIERTVKTPSEEDDILHQIQSLADEAYAVTMPG